MSEYKHRSIAFVINSLEGGGAERAMCNLLRIMHSKFTEDNYKIYLILLDHQPEQHQCPTYVEKITFDCNGNLITSYLNLNQWVKKNNPDLMVSFLTRSNLVTTLIGRAFNIPTMISERVNTSSHFATTRTGFISKLMVKIVYPQASVVLPVSQGVMRDLVQNYSVSEANCTIMYNAYNQAMLAGKAEQPVADLPKKKYFIGVGRLVPNKNFALLINAFAASRSKRDLVILGQGQELANLNDLIIELGLVKRVHMLGYKNNPYSYIKNADYLVSTSNAEGFPNGILEAMCLGKPVIATNCQSGPAEILSGDNTIQTNNYLCVEHGILCDVNNVQALSKAINTMEAEGQIVKYGQKSLERTAAFSDAAMHKTFVSLIQKVLCKTHQR